MKRSKLHLHTSGWYCWLAIAKEKEKGKKKKKGNRKERKERKREKEEGRCVVMMWQL